ncbi:MAG: elongation factor P [Verrucomicrobiota bacterium]|jgi:elongation factor P
MQTVLPSEFKRMMALMLDGAPHIIEDFHVSGTAQTRHKLHVRLRHLKGGHVVERVFAENERVPVVQFETRRITYSYSQGGTHVFIDVETFDELDLSDEQLGERRWFLKDEQEYKALLLEGRLVEVVLPAQVALKVIETAPPVRGGSDSNWKEAKLETGLQIMVPLFVAKGETVRVDTAEKKYAGREN